MQKYFLIFFISFVILACQSEQKQGVYSKIISFSDSTSNEEKEKYLSSLNDKYKNGIKISAFENEPNLYLLTQPIPIDLLPLPKGGFGCDDDFSLKLPTPHDLSSFPSPYVCEKCNGDSTKTFGESAYISIGTGKKDICEDVILSNREGYNELLKEPFSRQIYGGLVSSCKPPCCCDLHTKRYQISSDDGLIRRSNYLKAIISLRECNVKSIFKQIKFPQSDDFFNIQSRIIKRPKNGEILILHVENNQM